jgi:hypothetical protein
MSIANPKRSARGLLNLNPRVLITKTLVGAAVVLGSCVVATAPASADPKPSDPNANPFGDLGCSCQATALASSSFTREELARGIQDGSHGLPFSATPRAQ